MGQNKMYRVKIKLKNRKKPFYLNYNNKREIRNSKKFIKGIGEIQEIKTPTGKEVKL